MADVAPAKGREDGLPPAVGTVETASEMDTLGVPPPPVYSRLARRDTGASPFATALGLTGLRPAPVARLRPRRHAAQTCRPTVVGTPRRLFGASIGRRRPVPP